MAADGHLHPIPAPLPGTATGVVRTTRIGVDEGRIEVELLGLPGGVVASAELESGAGFSHQDLTVTLADLVVRRGSGERPEGEVRAVFSVTRGGEQATVEAVSTVGASGSRQVPGAVPGAGGLLLTLSRLLEGDRGVEVELFDPGLPRPAPIAAAFVVDVATKPFIAAVWAGTVLVILGTVLAIVRRRRDRMSEPGGLPATPAAVALPVTAKR
jgi:hypothetical protein